MGRRLRMNADCCPECGHLLPKKILNCQFCGWKLCESQYNTLMDRATAENERREIITFEYTGDIDRFMDKLHGYPLSTSPPTVDVMK